MQFWLEKFNSLTRGMLFGEGYMSPSMVDELRAGYAGAPASQEQAQSTSGAAHIRPRRACTLICGAWWINLR